MNYYFGFIGVLTYGFIAYKSGWYGDSILNIFFYLPIQFIGYYLWKKNYMIDDTTVISRKLTYKQMVVCLIGIVSSTIVLGLLLDKYDRFIGVGESIYGHIDTAMGIYGIGGILDASTVTLSIFAQLLMIKAFREQWLVWIAVNVITIVMWSLLLYYDRSALSWALPVLIMWIAYFINSINGFRQWYGASK